jgi:hypothetical protein
VNDSVFTKQSTLHGAWGNAALERVERAVAKTRERLLKATALLRAANIPYAVAGGNAVASWVGRIDEGAVRNTRDVDLLIQRSDLTAARAALESGGFVHWPGPGFDVFRDGIEGKPSEGIHILFAGERVYGDDAMCLPDLSQSEDSVDFRIVSLQALVQMKLIANRDKDRTHLRDLIGVGLIDPSWVGRFPLVLAARLQHLFDTPNG